MGSMAYLLIVHHSPTGKLRTIADTVLDAARAAAREASGELDEELEVREREALEPDAGELHDAAAVILGTSANFGYISGALKHYLDSTFLENQDREKPFSYWIRGGYDTTGAENALEKIATGFGWTPAADPVTFTGDVEPHLDELRALAENTVGAYLLSASR